MILPVTRAPDDRPESRRDTTRAMPYDRAVVAPAAGLPEASIEVVDTIDSTNLELMRRPMGPGGHRCVLLAGMQVAGRGRRGRVFISDPDDSLTVSVACDDPFDPAAPALTGLSIALGVEVARTLAPLVPGIGLKWPNDLLRDGRKVGGMLIESRLSPQMRRIVAGQGLNLRMPAALAEQIGQPVAGLFDHHPMPVSRDVLAGRIAGGLIRRIERFLREGFGDTASEWAPFDVLAGREVSVIESGRPTLVGIARGVGPDGCLLLQTPEGVVEVSVGDVSARLGDLRQAPAAGASARGAGA